MNGFANYAFPSALLTLSLSGFATAQPVTGPATPIPDAQPIDSPIAAAGGGRAACAGFDFAGKPIVRTQPRLGLFAIPPTGCGSYSALDAVQGVTTPAKPPAAYPAFGLMSQSFFDADFRYLDKPDAAHDFSDSLKRIPLGDSILFSTGGSTWTRFMNETNSRLGRVDNNYYLSRSRLFADVWYEDRFRFFAEGITAWSYWENLPPLAIDRNKFDFLNLFAEARLWDDGSGPVSLRVGRQELAFGSQRLISQLDWANTRRTFQGVRAVKTSETLDLDAFWVQPVIPNSGQFDSVDNNVNFAGAWSTLKPKAGTTADAYYLYLDDTNVTRQQGILRGARSIHTVGGRFAGDHEGTYLWDFEGAVQLGSDAGRDVFAGMGTAGLGYHVKDLPGNPTFWAYYDYASGDSNPANGRVTTFQQLFPFGHYYLGWADLVGRQNVHDLNCAVYVYPTKWVTGWVQYHNFWLARPQDALYGISGNVSRRDPTGNSGTHVGQEVDGVVNLHLSARSDLLVGYSHLFGGSFLKNTQTPARADSSGVFFLQVGTRW